MIDSARVTAAWGISVGSMHWSACRAPVDHTTQPQIKHPRVKSIPASVLLGWASGEPLRLDCWAPPHPRGTASHWPLDAVVTTETGSGRFPLAAAWTGRHNDLSWRWKPDAEFRELDSLEAVCFGASQLTKIHAHKGPSAIVIPNDFKQREQQRLLDSCSVAGVNASLIWLPVAATLAWMDDHGDLLPRPFPQSEERLTVHVVHADWGRILCSTLTLVVRPDEYGCRWIPARRHPAVSDWAIPGFGWSSVRVCDAEHASEVWRSIFILAEEANPKNCNFKSSLLEEMACWVVPQMSSIEVDKKLANYLSSAAIATVIIFVGDFAQQLSKGPNVANLNISSSFVADGLDGEDLLARGASIYARDRLCNRVSYLDTLPNLELFVDRNSEYEWMPLLDNKDQFVAGGQKWVLPLPIEGLSIRTGASSVKLVVAHDEYEGVRELHAKLDHSCERTQFAKLHVSAVPAQGNAKLELITIADVDTPARTILAKWDQMSPVLDSYKKPVDKGAYLKLLPRAYPELLPRKMSSAKWESALPLINELNESIITTKLEAIITDQQKFSILKQKLLAKDQTESPHDATAVSSDGKVSHNQESLDTLKSTLLSLWQITKDGRTPVLSTIVRALGYISVDDLEFEDWLVNHLHNDFHDRQCVLHTSGLAMRSPRNIFKLVMHVFYLNGDIASPNSNALKAISQVLRYRRDATKQIDSSTCQRVIEECLKIFERGMNNGGGGYPFRWSSLIVVYMLRRRMFDLGFLEPEQELAIQAKGLFRRAIELFKQKRLRPLGGSVDLPSALQQMIDYIDRRGSGDILMAGDYEPRGQ
jgi:hypothetical protein